MRRSGKPWDINVLRAEPDSVRSPESICEAELTAKPGAKPMQAMDPDPSMLATRIAGALAGRWSRLPT
jgi:hypothetical protein